MQLRKSLAEPATAESKCDATAHLRWGSYRDRLSWRGAWQGVQKEEHQWILPYRQRLSPLPREGLPKLKELEQAGAADGAGNPTDKS